jgi:P-type conjugative transfer protein TrbJ
MSKTPSENLRSRPSRRITRLLQNSALALVIAAAPLSGAPPASAQIVVYDPANVAQAIEQVRQAIQQVTLLTQQLEAQARMLAQSPFDQTADIRAAIDDLNGLAADVRGIASEASRLRQQFEAIYPEDLSARALTDMVRDAETRIATTRNSVEDTLRLSAEVEARRGAGADRMRDALAASRSAQGQTGAMQATTQAIGALSEQLSTLEALLAAQARMAGAEAAARASREAQSRETRTRLWDPSRAASPMN